LPAGSTANSSVRRVGGIDHPHGLRAFERDEDVDAVDVRPGDVDQRRVFAQPIGRKVLDSRGQKTMRWHASATLPSMCRIAVVSLTSLRSGTADCAAAVTAPAASGATIEEATIAAMGLRPDAIEIRRAG
jgi:hypothetical protein